MKIRDIVNRDIVNLSNCDQEPIHIPGSIQPHGFLLAFNKDLHIEYCSGNVHVFTGLQHTQLLNKHIAAILDPAELKRFNEYVGAMTTKLNAPLILAIVGRNYNCNIHLSGQLIVVECELLLNTQPQLSTVYDQTVQFVKYMQDATTLQQLCDKVATEIRELTGYDRVMVYRFDKWYNGEVYAENKREDLESFLGLHYPHTDIPVQARELYIRNLLRIIVDINYEPVPIYTIDDAENKNIDLSISVLRSTSPIHVQYLQNMGVGATLTISLIHEGKLWGLIACHHYTAKYIDHYSRINAQLQGHFLTSQINIREAAEEYGIAREVNNALEKMLNKTFKPERNSLQDIIQEPSLLTLCNAAGVAIIVDGIIYKNGTTPTEEQIFMIANWATPFSQDRFFTTAKLIDDMPEAEGICNTASGIIFYALRSFHDACIIWFNPETLEEVTWAGDPEKAIEKNENGLSPRKSFEGWKVITKCQAREWKDPELKAAANYAYALQKHLTYILLNEEDVRQRLLSEQLKDSNAELENINWISTHDLKEPLRKIQVFSSKLLMKEAEHTDDVNRTLHKMNNAANRMQKLIEGLSLYSKARQTEENFSMINLQTLVENIIIESQDDFKDSQAIVTAGGLPVVYGIPVLLNQLFVNLIQNAIKFAKKDLPAIVAIESSPALVVQEGTPDKSFHKITVTDNGIGFEPEMNSIIFKIFSRLNAVSDYNGSGIGLALCKKILQLHHGFIEASGEPGNGATFSLYFPAKKN